MIDKLIKFFFIALVLLSNNSVHFYVFTSSSCNSCSSAIATLQKNVPANSITQFEITEEKSLNGFTEITKLISDIYLPLPLFGVFHGDNLTTLVAGGPNLSQWSGILNDTSKGVKVYVDEGFGNIQKVKVIEDPSEIKDLQDIFQGVNVGYSSGSFWSIFIPVVGAAIIDAVNPCAFSVLVVLLTFVFYSVNRRSVIYVGASFSLAVFLTYTIMGLGFIQILSKFFYFKYIIFVFIIFLGITRIREFFSGKNEHLPNSFVNIINTQIEKISTPRNAFFAGVLTALFILPCSSGPYFVALNLVTNSNNYLEGVSLIVLYNLIVIAPFLLITIFIHKMIIDTYRVKNFITKERRWFNLLIGILLIMLSIFLLI